MVDTDHFVVFLLRVQMQSAFVQPAESSSSPEELLNFSLFQEWKITNYVVKSANIDEKNCRKKSTNKQTEVSGQPTGK